MIIFYIFSLIHIRKDVAMFHFSNSYLNYDTCKWLAILFLVLVNLFFILFILYDVDDAIGYIKTSAYSEYYDYDAMLKLSSS